MRSLEPGFIESQPITQSLLQTIRLIGEYRGKQDLYRNQSPQVLETLREAAMIQSTESSNRIEGVTAPLERIKSIVARKTRPRNRSEREIVGYRDVLNRIHADYGKLTLDTKLILGFHRDMYRLVPGAGGQWKDVNNEITEMLPDGSWFTRFRPVAADQVARAMDQLQAGYGRLLQSGEVEPLLLIPACVLDFLCIHPFRDGNGRVARLLTLFLLYRAGYEVGRYISLEMIVEQTRDSYYDTLYRSSQNWHEGKHDLRPWWEYFLGVMLQTAYGEFEHRVGLVSGVRGGKSALVLDFLQHAAGEFSVRDILRRCPNVGVDLARRILRRERTAGRLKCLGRGPDARWRKI